MKHFYLVLSALIVSGSSLSGQSCATVAGQGSASNAFTNIRNATNSVAADKNLNTVLLIHRNNATAFGGSSGQLRYDVSTDGGTTWSNNNGVLNPLLTFNARYPQAAIYNPTGNTTPSSAYISYMAPTVDAGGNWNGMVSGVRQLSGTGNTESYNQASTTQTLIPNSMVKGAPGVMWTIDAVWTGTSITGFKIYKGTWNGTNDFVWTTSTTLTPTFNTAYSGANQVGDYHIAFDPTGQYGWVSILTHITPGPSPYAFYPVFYRTTDGGVTWSGPTQVDVGSFPCITANIVAGNTATTAFESDLAVDVNGEPHLITTVCNGNNAYAVFFGNWHHMYEFTYHYGLWNANDISNVNAGRGTWGTSPNATTMDTQPMAARSADGTKIFYGWCDNSTYTLGQANQSPNFFSRAYNVTTRTWTSVRDYTSCNVVTSGLVFYPKLAAEVLEPSAGVYKLAAAYTLFTSNDPILTASFRFLDNMTYQNSDFIFSITPATVSIDQGSSWLLCPAATLNLSITGSYNQILWSNGAGTLTTSVNTPGTYTVAVRSGCTLGIDTISVTGLTSSINASASAVCPGSSSLLTASGNALSYTWNPGNVVNDSLNVTPSATTTYTLTATGDGGCTYDVNSTVTVYPQPVVTASVSAAAVCIGDSATISGTGASTYAWQPGSLSGSSISVSPASSTTYVLTGTDANGCVDVDSVNLAVNPLPVLVLTADTNTICNGDTVHLMAAGASSYSWTPAGSLSNASASMTDAYPSSTTMYMVMATDSNGCANSDSVQITVNPLPVIDATGTSPICAGDTTFLNATGASAYMWMPINMNGPSVMDIPASSQQYVAVGTDLNGCSNTDTVSVVVNPLPSIIISGNDTICSGAMTTLSANGGTSYVWSPSGATTSTISDTPSSTTVYSVSGTDANGCSNSDTLTVIVHQLPSVTLSIPASQVCVDDGTLSIAGTGSPTGGTFSGNGVSGTGFNPGTAGLGSQTITYAYIDGNGCSNTATDVIVVNACVGMTENNAVPVEIYPNPFRDELVFESSAAGKLRVEVYTVHGEKMLVREISTGRELVSTAAWAPGFYFITVVDGDNRSTVKLVKE